MLLTRSFSRFTCLKRLIGSNINQFVSKKSLHVSTISCVKKYLHAETDFIYKFVPNYENVEISECKETFKLRENYEGNSKEELIEDFEAFSHFCADTETCMSDTAYNDFIKALVDQVPSFSDDQLSQVLAILQRFPQTKNTHSNNFHQLWKKLDWTCHERCTEWKHQTILKFCNLWFKLYLTKVSDFTGKGITKILRRVDRLPASALVETMFYLTVCRNKLESMAAIESRFLEVFDQLSIDEIGIVGLAFFKTESRIQQPELTIKIYDKTIKEIDNLQDITLTNILKILRYSSFPAHSGKIEQLSEVLVPKVKDASLIACLHIILLGTNLQYCHQRLLEEVVKKYNENLKSTRLKDIERITFALSLFNFKTESGIEQELLLKIVDELKSRVDEIVQHPKSFSSAVHFLSVCGIHDMDLLRSVLKEDFLEFAYGKSKIASLIL